MSPEAPKPPGPTVGAPATSATPRPAPAPHPGAPGPPSHAGAAHPAPTAPAKPKDEMDFVRVKNTGKVKWIGADFKDGASESIEPGGEGRVTLKKARQLIDDYAPHAKDDGVAGPFEIIEDKD